MVSLDLGSSLKAAARIAALTVAAISYVALARASSLSDAAALEITGQIEAIQARSGPTSPD